MAKRFFEFLRRWRVALQIAFVALVVAAYVYLSQHHNLLLEAAETRLADFRLNTRPARAAPKDIVILGVDESAFTVADWGAETLARNPDLALMTKDWPWDRALWGRLTDRLVNAGAKLVAFDILFKQPTRGDLECGPIFEKHAARVMLTSMFSAEETALGVSQAVIEPNDDLIPLQGAEIVGLANFFPDQDGVTRRITHGFVRDLLIKPDLAKTPAAGELKPDLFTFTWLGAAKVLGHAPDRDPTQPMLINFYAEGGGFKIIPIEDVLLNWGAAYKNGEYFKNMVVLVGAVSEVRFKDDQHTPLGAIHGVALQATALANLVQGDWLRIAPGWIAPALAIVFGLIALLVSLRVNSVLWKVGLLAGFGFLFVVVTYWLFARYLLIVPVSGAFLGLVVCGGFGTIYDFVLERYERRRMLGVFETMVSPGVANLVLSHRDDFEQRLGGQRKDVVVLFSDIRGFTTWSEKVGPDALVAQLNEYFFGIVEVIQQEGGTVQKYIGDALMAAWGDVREQPLKECAVQSVRAAFKMVKSLEEMNAGWVGKAKREQLGFGIGLNLGEGVVGRIGHPRRQEFTVMGDAVNLAARLESATKQYHQTILTGAQIYELAKDEFYFRLADKMQVKGKTFAVPVYAPVAPRTSVPPPGLAEYDAAIEKYYARNFAGAAELFKMANEKMGGHDFLCENYLERIAAFLVEPPPADWDGGWELKDK